ncbi:unnamed protein product [Eruca vesicaria subsp. sativa]|uniref:Uncharacterized protein n=1 Tax=Eruca vesicaria subsp. sativa TaxID=29727 RepID=A0ABC8KK62_ERUVS|nr:unnamed protein product [Eruca vesicaria subsp. sativa]
MSQSIRDLLQVCECLKSVAGSVISIELVGTLPTSCGVSAPYPTSLSSNCDEYTWYATFVDLFEPSSPVFLEHKKHQVTDKWLRHVIVMQEIAVRD